MKPIERAAEALHNHIHHDCEYAVVGIFAQKLWQDRARAVLMALREPSKDMIAAGHDKAADCMDTDFDSDRDGERHYYSYLRSDAPKPIWQAMIDEALGDSIDTAQTDS
jgi:hypothetical protein